jgi:uncharacterized protein (TIGR00725 family)
MWKISTKSTLARRNSQPRGNRRVVKLFVTAEDQLYDSEGRIFSAAEHRWLKQPLAPELAGTALASVEAVARLIAHGARRLPVGVIGANDASAAELAFAEQAGAGIARLGLPLICGGRGGCMEAASRGAAEAGGLVLGVLPSGDWMSANAHVSIPIASGLGEARNAIIASACFALLAVGGGHGTLSEMGLGLKMGRLVVAMPTAARVPGALDCAAIPEAMEHVALRYLGLDA